MATLPKVLVLGLLLAATLGLAWMALPDAPRADPVMVEGTASASCPSLQQILAHPDLIPSHHHPLVGRPAPDFELSGPDGLAYRLTELRARGPVLLIFYYGDHCSHCLGQLIEIERQLPLFHEVGAQVVAIDEAPAETTRPRRFGFPVLSDSNNRLARIYGVFKPGPDLLRHGTFLIDREGTVRWANVGDAPFRRNSALLSHLAKMQGRLPSAP